jgi:putative membrane protein
LKIVADTLIVLVAVIHVYILVLEMFEWNTPRGRKAFDLTPEFAEETKVLAANQGLYNGFLAAGLGYALIRQDFGTSVLFLAFVIVAGVFGAVTASRKILFVQVVPGAIALLFVLLAHP